MKETAASWSLGSVSSKGIRECFKGYLYKLHAGEKLASNFLNLSKTGTSPPQSKDFYRSETDIPVCIGSRIINGLLDSPLHCNELSFLHGGASQRVRISPLLFYRYKHQVLLHLFRNQIPLKARQICIINITIKDEINRICSRYKKLLINPHSKAYKFIFIA